MECAYKNKYIGSLVTSDSDCRGLHFVCIRSVLFVTAELNFSEGHCFDVAHPDSARHEYFRFASTIFRNLDRLRWPLFLVWRCHYQ